jgi:oligoribonuclease NrnB/cAMP/cGMP phosphodiesterase (DHH superfamily)
MLVNRLFDDNLKICVLYHGNCPDGLASAFVMQSVYKNCDLVAVVGHDIIASITEEKLKEYGCVYIVDIACTKDVLDHFKKYVPLVKVLDHHLPSLCLVDEPDCVITTEMSAAQIVWYHFFPDTLPPKWIDYIAARDRWIWTMENSKEFTAGYVKFYGGKLNMDVMHKLYVMTDDQEKEIITLGKECIEEDNKIIQGAFDKMIEKKLILPNGTKKLVKYIELKGIEIRFL